MKKIFMSVGLLCLLIAESANAHQMIQASPFYYGSSAAISYEYGFSKKSAIAVGYSHLGASDTGTSDTYVNLYSLSWKWSPFTQVGQGMYVKLGGAKVTTNVFDSIPIFGSYFSDMAGSFLPYVIGGWDFRLGNSWAISLELGTDIRFLTLGYKF